MKSSRVPAEMDYFRMPQSRNKLIITVTLIGWVVLIGALIGGMVGAMVGRAFE